MAIRQEEQHREGEGGGVSRLNQTRVRHNTIRSKDIDNDIH